MMNKTTGINRKFELSPETIPQKLLTLKRTYKKLYIGLPAILYVDILASMPAVTVYSKCTHKEHKKLTFSTNAYTYSCNVYVPIYKYNVDLPFSCM